MKSKKILISEKITFWDIIWKYTIRDFILETLSFVPASVGIILRMFIYKLFFKKIGKGFTVKKNVHFKFPERIVIGNHVGIDEYTLIDGDGSLIIGDFTRIGAHVDIVTHGLYDKDKNTPRKLQGKWTKKVVIGKDVEIGVGARILPGVKIGNGAFIGANSVVVRDVPPYSVVMGMPARIIRLR